MVAHLIGIAINGTFDKVIRGKCASCKNWKNNRIDEREVERGFGIRVGTFLSSFLIAVSP